MTTKKRDNNVSDVSQDQEIVAYLKKNPDFFVRNPSVLEVMELPARYSGEQIVDLQHEALKRLRAKQDLLVDNSRTNMSVQTATHEAVLAMLEARTLDEFIGIVQDELPVLLDIDMAAVALEGAVEQIDMSEDGLPVLLPAGEVQKRLGEGDVQLIASVQSGDPLFGAARDLVRSVALARLYSSDVMPTGLLILGARDENMFNPHQGTELITFMARVAEILVEKWLAQGELED